MRRKIFVLAAAVLAGSIVPAYAQAPNARVFNGGAGVILFTIKSDKTEDFEMVMNKTKEALAKSAKPERKEQAANWKLFKSDAPGVNGSVMYVMIVDPALKDADYSVINVLNDVFPAEIQELFKAYTESFASGLIPINLLPVMNFK